MTSSAGFKSDDLGKLILRLAVGGLLLLHGVFKVQSGVAWMEPMLAQNGLPKALAYGVDAGEVVAPILIVAGLWTRLAALVVAFDLLMAVVLVFRDKIFTLKESGGGWTIELESFFILAALALFFLGGGSRIPEPSLLCRTPWS